MASCAACGRAFSEPRGGDNPICAACRHEGAVLQPSLTRPNQVQPVKVTFPHLITTTLIAINVLVFAFMVLNGVSPTYPGAGKIIQWGGNFVDTLTGQYWRLLTANYLHYGIIHLLANMWCLWGLGRLIELFYSKTDYLLLYTFTGIASSLLSISLHPMVVSAGASGAVFGLAGVLLATLKWGSLGLPENARTALFKNILQFAGINLVVGLSLPGIDNAGHVGGLLSGVLVGAVMGKHLDDSPDSTTLRRGTWIMLFGALLIGLALSIKWHSHLLSRLR